MSAKQHRQLGRKQFGDYHNRHVCANLTGLDLRPYMCYIIILAGVTNSVTPNRTKGTLATANTKGANDYDYY